VVGKLKVLCFIVVLVDFIGEVVNSIGKYAFYGAKLSFYVARSCSP